MGMRNLELKVLLALILTRATYTSTAQRSHDGGATEAPAKPGIVLLANDIDYALAQEFDARKEEKFIVILGGPDAYDGVGEKVRKALAAEEQNHLREKGNRKMYVKTNVWRKGQVVYIIAGSDRDQTRKAHEENREKLDKKVKKAIDNEVKIREFAFAPATKTVEVGDVVTWTNEDSAAHTATQTGGFDSRRLEKEGSRSIIFEAPGTLEYRCTCHPSMRGKVIVNTPES